MKRGKVMNFNLQINKYQLNNNSEKTQKNSSRKPKLIFLNV